MTDSASPPYSRQEVLRVLLRRVVVGLGMDLQVRIREDEAVVRGILAGPDTRFFKGRGAEALRGLQHLVDRILSQDERFEKVPLVEIEGQREEEDLQLRRQARDAAEEARRTGEPVRLPPLNPWERRIVHLALRDEADLRTYSTGEGHYRRLNVSLADVAPAAAGDAGVTDVSGDAPAVVVPAPATPTETPSD
jgi:spoIIIJ-associated protein